MMLLGVAQRGKIIGNGPVVSRDAGPSQLIIADDHPLFRSALRQMMGRQPDLEVVGEAGDVREALELCRRPWWHRPISVYLAHVLPKMNDQLAHKECPTGPCRGFRGRFPAPPRRGEGQLLTPR